METFGSYRSGIMETHCGSCGQVPFGGLKHWLTWHNSFPTDKWVNLPLCPQNCIVLRVYKS